MYLLRQLKTAGPVRPVPRPVDNDRAAVNVSMHMYFKHVDQVVRCMSEVDYVVFAMFQDEHHQTVKITLMPMYVSADVSYKFK
jgi:hypothetical protein